MTRYFIFVFILFCFGCSNDGQVDRLISKKHKSFLLSTERMVDDQPQKAKQNVDSLINLNQALDDASFCKIFQIKQKASLKLFENDAVMSYGDSIRKYAEKIGDSLSIAKSLVVLPDTYIDYSKRKSMNPFLPMALRIFNKPDSQKEYATVLKLKVFQLEYEGEFNAALDLLLKAYAIFIQLGEKKEEAKIAQMIANVYGDLKNPELALKYYKIFEQSATTLNDSVLMASAYTNFGIFYRKTQPDSSIYFYNKALAIHYRKPFSLSRVQTEYNLTNVYLDKKDLKTAKNRYESLIQVCNEHNYKEGLVMMYNGLSTIYFLQNNSSQAVSLMRKSIQLADSMNMTGIAMRLRPEFIEALYGNESYKAAADELIKNNKIKDSFLTNEKQIALIELEKKYQEEVKEKENQYLQFELKFRKTVIIILACALILLGILFRQRIKLHKEREISYNALMNLYKEEKASRQRDELLKNATIEDDIVLTLYDKIIEYYTIEKPYLNSKFRVDDLALAIGSSQKEIAQILKEKVNQNFSSFTNKYRIEAARRFFEDKAYFNLKMEVIAEKSGFGTIQSFYNAFELYTGVKPGFYRSNIQKELDQI